MEEKMIQEVKPPELKILKNNLLDAKSQKIIEENKNLDSNPPNLENYPAKCVG